jgi:hypothetical protein
MIVLTSAPHHHPSPPPSHPHPCCAICPTVIGLQDEKPADPGSTKVDISRFTNLFPHINRVREEGAVFNQAHTVSPKCAPSRFGLMTGRLPSRSIFAQTHRQSVGEARTNVQVPTSKLMGSDLAKTLATELAANKITTIMVRCAFSGRNLHSRMSLDPTHVRLKLLHACDQWHSSQESTALIVAIVNYAQTL